MKIIAIERESATINPGGFQRYAEEEARSVWNLYQANSIREVYFRADQTTAVLMLECTSTIEAEEILANLPYVREGLIEFDLIPLAPYPGFARLFGKGEA